VSYQIVNHDGEYLAQTAQLFLEVELQNQDGVYCMVRSFRADSPDSRHLNEFSLTLTHTNRSRGLTTEADPNGL
jgi:aspartyl/asparaginyl-tRNA synthetase